MDELKEVLILFANFREQMEKNKGKTKESSQTMKQKPQTPCSYLMEHMHWIQS